MSNISGDHPSVRVHAPPGGHSNNIFGTKNEDTNAKPSTLAGQYKQTQMKSNIFGTDEPAPTRAAPNKNRSNVFGNDDDDQSKRQSGLRQGIRDPNASRMGYNPINGESYSTKNDVNSNTVATEKQADLPAKTNDTENTNAQATVTNSTDKSDNTTDGNNAPKNVHTSVRVFHPPGGKSSGPLW